MSKKKEGITISSAFKESTWDMTNKSPPFSALILKAENGDSEVDKLGCNVGEKLFKNVVRRGRQLWRVKLAKCDKMGLLDIHAPDKRQGNKQDNGEVSASDLVELYTFANKEQAFGLTTRSLLQATAMVKYARSPMLESECPDLFLGLVAVFSQLVVQKPEL
jgi:hypothetical protein